MKTRLTMAGVTLFCLILSGCAMPKGFFQSRHDALSEYVLKGEDKDKILFIPVYGVISNEGKKGFFSEKPGMLQEICAHLALAEKDEKIKAVLFTVNSPGGSATDSDVLFNEIDKFRQKTGRKVAVLMMNVAASGGYYISLAADKIFAHPTTITGSIGTIFLSPRISGLMDKIGVRAEVTKSGKFKDMGSPFRESTEEEKKLVQDVLESMNSRFLNLVSRKRGISPEKLKVAAQAQIMTAGQALALGLIDGVGYFDETVTEIRKMAGLSDNPRIVVYRRNHYPNDNVYNPFTMDMPDSVRIFDFGNLNPLNGLHTGYYYLYAPDTVE